MWDLSIFTKGQNMSWRIARKSLIYRKFVQIKVFLLLNWNIRKGCIFTKLRISRKWTKVVLFFKNKEGSISNYLRLKDITRDRNSHATWNFFHEFNESNGKFSLMEQSDLICLCNLYLNTKISMKQTETFSFGYCPYFYNKLKSRALFSKSIYPYRKRKIW